MKNLETWQSQWLQNITVLKFPKLSGAGIKMEGLLLYLSKYGIGGPEFGIKEEL